MTEIRSRNISAMPPTATCGEPWLRLVCGAKWIKRQIQCTVNARTWADVWIRVSWRDSEGQQGSGRLAKWKRIGARLKMCRKCRRPKSGDDMELGGRGGKDEGAWENRMIENC